MLLDEVSWRSDVATQPFLNPASRPNLSHLLGLFRPDGRAAAAWAEDRPLIRTAIAVLSVVYVCAYIMSRFKVAMCRFIIFRQKHTDIRTYGHEVRAARIALGMTGTDVASAAGRRSSSSSSFGGGQTSQT